MRRLLVRLFICGCVVTASFFVSLDLLEYFDVSTSTNCAAAPNGETVALSPPYLNMGGYAYKFSIPQLSHLSDTAEKQTYSRVVICEGDQQLGPAHTLWLEITQKGFGRFSHYNDAVVFSSSDNTDPNSNGRQYKIVIPPLRCRGLVFLLGIC
jgi:hypothetical protein